MKKFLKLSFLFLFFSACNSNDQPAEKETKPENAMDAAATFLRAALDGDYTTVRAFSVNDSTNKQLLDISEWKYNKELTAEEKKEYKKASIRFLKDTHEVNDSVTIIHYSNSYKNKPDSLKVIRSNDNWIIDLNFTFQTKDTIP